MGKSPYICFIKLIYVADKKRNLGIGRKLISSLKEICRDWGVSTFEFMCEDRHIEYWKKEQGARKVSTLMVVED
jgi:GNAT superfamily N-acetyltransferase